MLLPSLANHPFRHSSLDYFILKWKMVHTQWRLYHKDCEWLWFKLKQADKCKIHRKKVPFSFNLGKSYEKWCKHHSQSLQVRCILVRISSLGAIYVGCHGKIWIQRNAINEKRGKISSKFIWIFFPRKIFTNRIEEDENPKYIEINACLKVIK